MERISARITNQQRRAVEGLGDGDFSRGLRVLIARELGVGPVDVPRGLACVSPRRRREISSLGGKARPKS